MTGDKCSHPKFPSFVWGWEGAQQCYILRDQTTGDLKSHHLQAQVTLTALSVPPWQPFLSAVIGEGGRTLTVSLGHIPLSPLPRSGTEESTTTTHCWENRGTIRKIHRDSFGIQLKNSNQHLLPKIIAKLKRTINTKYCKTNQGPNRAPHKRRKQP